MPWCLGSITYKYMKDKKTILNNEEKKEIMKQMKSNNKLDFVELVMEMKKKQRRKLNGNTKSN